MKRTWMFCLIGLLSLLSALSRDHMGAQCTLGFDLKPGPITQRDGAWVVGCCHLIGDLDGSGDSPQSPEQGEWISLLQPCPITNRLPRDQTILLLTRFCLSAIASFNFYGILLGPAYAATVCAVPALRSCS